MKWTAVNANEGKGDDQDEQANTGKDESGGLVGEFVENLIIPDQQSRPSQENNKLTDTNRTENFILNVDELWNDELIWHS